MERGSGGGLGRAFARARSWPLWAWIGAAAAASFVVLAALGGNDDEPVEAAGGVDTELSTTTSVAEEVDIAGLITDVPDGFSEAQMVSVVEAACLAMVVDDTATAAAMTSAAIEATQRAVTVEQFADALGVVSEVSPQVCPSEVESHPDLLVELVALSPATTTSTTTTTTTTLPTTHAPPPSPTPPSSASTHAPPPSPVPASSASYANCSEAHAAGVTPLQRGDVGYEPHLDGDADGVACEK